MKRKSKLTNDGKAKLEYKKQKEHEEVLARAQQARDAYYEYKRRFPGYSELFLGNKEDYDAESEF